MYVFKDTFATATLLDVGDLETFCPELSVRELLDEFDDVPFRAASSEPESTRRHPTKRRRCRR